MPTFDRHADTPEEARPERGDTAPGFRTLRTDDELRSALERAHAFERRVADRASARASRYARLSPG